MDQSPAAAAVELSVNKRVLIRAVSTGDTESVVDLLDRGVPLDTKDGKGISLLHWAAQGGNVTTLRLLIKRGCDVDSVDFRGGTPLHWAAAMGQTKAVQELFRNGAAKSVVAGDRGTPLHQAAMNGHVETVVAMLEEGCAFKALSSDGSTALHFAAQCGHVEVVRELVDRGCDVNAVKANGCAPIHCAAACGRTKVVCELIKLGATKSIAARNCGTPLHQAALGRQVETVVAMLEEGCALDVLSSDGSTVLHFAAQGGHSEVVREIVGRGCDVNAVKVNGCTPLHIAASFGRTEVVRELIKLGAIKSVVAGQFGTPLHQAALQGHVETIVAMLEEGCVIDIVNNNGSTALHFAAEGGNIEIVRELVDRGCDVNAVKVNGCTPLHSAAGCGRTEAVHELVKCGASKLVVAGNCGTPLHQAALQGHLETVVAMLEEGCPIEAVNGNGTTALHFAAQGGHVKVVRELVGRGCDVDTVKENGCTPLHSAAGFGRTEAVYELIKLGATKSAVAGKFGTPLHQAAFEGHVKAVEVLLEIDACEPDMIKTDAASLKVQTDSHLVNICDSVGETPVMYAVQGGQVDMFKLLTSQGGSVTDRDIYSVSTLEQCFVGGHACKLSQFCEACGISSRGKGLKGALADLISYGLVDPHKVLCLCAISGDSLFLEGQFKDLVASDKCSFPAAVKCAKHYFHIGDGVPFLEQLCLLDENALNPLQLSLLSLKCFKMGFADYCIQHGTNDHTLFISKLLSHPVLKETVNQNFPNGLSPLDLAQQFELHDIAALIEGAGGCPGVWANIPKDAFLSHRSHFFTICTSLSMVYDPSQGDHEVVKRAVIDLLGGQTVDNVVHIAGDSQLVKEQILSRCPDLGDVVTHVLPHIQVRYWKRVGLALGMKTNTLDGFGQQFSNDDDRYLETLTYWLEHGSRVTWKTLLDVLGHFETKHSMDDLTEKIISEVGGVPQGKALSGPVRPVTSFAPVVSGAAVAAERSLPDCKATLVRVIQNHAEDFLKEMNCKALVVVLRALELIPESVEYDILHSKSREEANAHLLKHLKEDADEGTVREVFRIASEKMGYKRMKTFAVFMLKQLQ